MLLLNPNMGIGIAKCANKDRKQYKQQAAPISITISVANKAKSRKYAKFGKTSLKLTTLQAVSKSVVWKDLRQRHEQVSS